MSKPSPYYRNEKERQELIQRRDSFQFTEADDLPMFVALLAGKEGSGKTHLACTMSQTGPVYLIDTEYRAQIVTKKFQNVKFTTAKNYLDLVVAVKHILSCQPRGTIIIDSGSDLQTFAEIEYLERNDKEKVGMAWNWSEVWRLCNAVIDEIKFSKKFNLIITARMKDEFVGEKATGRQIPRIYAPLPYKADVILQFANDKTRKIFLTKNGFTGNLSQEISNTDSLPSIVASLSDSSESLSPNNSQEEPIQLSQPRKLSVLRKAS